MTTPAWGLVALAAAAAVTDWAAVAAGSRRVEWVAKPATLVLLVGVAVSVRPAHPTTRDWFVAGLVASLAGDVALLGSERWFVVGLGAFLVGHLAFVTGLLLEQRAAGWAVAAVVAVSVTVAVVGRRVVVAVRRGPHPGLAVPVVVYVAAISVLVVSAWGTALLPAAAGAACFYTSDATLAWDRFVRPLPHGRLVVIVTYHLAQAGLVLSLTPLIA